MKNAPYIGAFSMENGLPGRVVAQGDQTSIRDRDFEHATLIVDPDIARGASRWRDQEMMRFKLAISDGYPIVPCRRNLHHCLIVESRNHDCRRAIAALACKKVVLMKDVLVEDEGAVCDDVLFL